MKNCFLLTVLIVLVFAQSANAATYFVDIDSVGGGCNDSNPGTQSQPWCTIAKANSTLQAGDTIHIRAGTYRETIRPSRSGSAGNYITYARYNNEKVVITGVSYGVDLRNRHYVAINGLTILDISAYWVNMRGADSTHSATHNIIQNCHMENSSRDAGWAGIYMDYGIEYNKIIDSTLIGLFDPDDLIYVNGDARYNLIEGNTLLYGSHQGIDFMGRSGNTFKNVIRNNRFWNPYHTALCVNVNANQTLIEGNMFLDSGEDNANNTHGTVRDREMSRRDHKGIQLASSNCIVRNNISVNNGTMSINTYLEKPANALNNRIYHNIFYKDYRALTTNCHDPVYGNVIKNNILHHSVEYESYQFVTNPPDDNYYVSNNILGSPVYRYPDGAQSVSFLETKYPHQWYDNSQVNPEFVNPGAVNDYDNRDLDPQSLALKPTSPMIDAGAFLTKTTSSGSSGVIPVEDASYFYDGWGIPGEQGDLIQLEGQAQTARITSIDYDNNRITVDRSLTWTAGQGLSLPYKGTAPDLGAFEYGAKILYGDVSENGSISAYDASLTAQHAVGAITLTSQQQTKADVSGEGTVSAFDASWIARKVVDEGVVFPAEQQ